MSCLLAFVSVPRFAHEHPRCRVGDVLPIQRYSTIAHYPVTRVRTLFLAGTVSAAAALLVTLLMPELRLQRRAPRTVAAPAA